MSANRITVAEWRKLSATPGPRKSTATPTKARRLTPLVAPAFDFVDGGIEVVVPLRLKSLNRQENGWARHKRVKREHAATTPLLDFAAGTPVQHRDFMNSGPWLVTATRLGPVLLDDDNNYGSLKAICDCVARWLGVSDAPDSPTKFVRGQEKSKAFGVRIRIEPIGRKQVA